MLFPSWSDTGRAHVWPPYTQVKTAPPPVPVIGTEGVYLHLADGRKVIDGLASWWTACHGYNHPYIQQAVQRQLTRMPHVMFGGITHEPACRLASRLADLMPGDLNRVFFSDSGSVAVEVALKMAVQFWLNRNQPERNQFVSFHNAYHGDTLGAMSVCDPQRSMHAHFRGFIPTQFSRPIPAAVDEAREFDDFLQQNHPRLAGVIIEPLVQGAGGMRFHGPASLRMIADSCRRHDVLLITDEIATGFGRTGSMFACEQAQVTPDIMCVGKALTAGMLGMAATIARERVFDAFWADDPSHALMHGPTYMANPLACAAANASLDLFQSEPRLEQVAGIEEYLPGALEPCRQLPGVVDVRAKGAVGVVQVVELHRVDRLRREFVEAGVWIRPFADMIYITPPLTITATELEQLCEAMVTVVRRWSEWK